MINELYMMTQVLKEKNLLKVTTHGDIDKSAQKAGIYVEIARDGKPKNIEYVPKEKFEKFWKHSKGGHNSFPVIRIQNAMIKHDLPKNFDNTWNKIKRKSEKIEILLQLNYDSYNPKSNDIIISQWTLGQLLPICKDNPPLEALNALINRFPRNREEQEDFYLAFLSFAKNQLVSFEDPLIELMKGILIGRWDKGKDRFISGIQIFFDVYDGYAFQYKVMDLKLKNVLIKELNKRDISENKTLKVDNCQLTGSLQVLEKDKYPSPNLPNLGKSYLYSNNRDIP
ncbi:MAG: hypothetical protein PHS13_09490, partial [Firmicutes bacterium]|nr:hypothetical protein [Bacillota bacterium]